MAKLHIVELHRKSILSKNRYGDTYDDDDDDDDDDDNNDDDDADDDDDGDDIDGGRKLL